MEMNNLKSINPIDGDGVVLHDKDRVFTHGFTDNGWERFYGTLNLNDEDSEIIWWIEYDDKEQFVVLDFSDVFKA